MKVIKLAILSFVFLFVLIFLISLLIPSHIVVSRATDIDAPRDSVMAMIRDAGRWKGWYPRIDSAKPLYVEGKLRGLLLDDKDPKGPTYLQLETESVDEVTALFVGNKIKPVLNTWKVIGHPDSGTLTLQWSMDFQLRWYPWEKFASLVLEKSNGQRMEIGLANIKKSSEINLSSNSQ